MILFMSIERIGFSDFVLRRVCKRWRAFLTADKVVVNSLPVARLFINSYRGEGLTEPWKSFREIREAKSSLVMSILGKWTLNDLNINPSDCDWFIDNIYDHPNIDPFDYAQMIKKMSASLPDIFDFEGQECWMDHFPKCFSTTDVKVFITALLRDGKYPRYLKTKPQVSVYVLDYILTNRIGSKDLLLQIVNQTDCDLESLLLLLIDHALDKCYNEDALRLLVPSYKGPIDSISNLLEKVQDSLPVFIQVLLGRLLIRCILRRKPYPRIRHALISDVIIYATMIESQNVKEFTSIFPLIVDSFKFGDRELRLLTYGAVSKLIVNE